MKRSLLNKAALILALVCANSCVSQTSYNSLLEENGYLYNEVETLRDSNEDLEQELEELKSEKEELDERVLELEDIIERARYELENAEWFSDLEYALDILDEM